MFEFFTSIFSKIASLFAATIIAVGLVSAPAIEPIQQVSKNTPAETIQEIKKPEKTEATEAPKTFIPKPESKAKEKIKIFQLPSGAIIDEQGNIFNQAELDQKNRLEELERKSKQLEEQIGQEPERIAEELVKRNQLLEEQNRILQQQTQTLQQIQQQNAPPPPPSSPPPPQVVLTVNVYNKSGEKSITINPNETVSINIDVGNPSSNNLNPGYTCIKSGPWPGGPMNGVYYISPVDHTETLNFSGVTAGIKTLRVICSNSSGEKSDFVTIEILTPKFLISPYVFDTYMYMLSPAQSASGPNWRIRISLSFIGAPYVGVTCKDNLTSAIIYQTNRLENQSGTSLELYIRNNNLSWNTVYICEFYLQGFDSSGILQNLNISKVLTFTTPPEPSSY